MKLAITGAGAVTPWGATWAELRAALSDPAAARASAFRPAEAFESEDVVGAVVAECWGFNAKDHLGQKGLRNFDRLTRRMIVAGKYALEHAGIKKDGEFIASSPERAGICSATAYGSLDAITELNLVAELEDPRYMNPARFPNTVINAAAGYVSIWEDLRALNVTVVDGNCGSLDAFLAAETHLRCGRADVLLVGGGEVMTEPLYRAMRKLGIVRDPAKADSQGIEFGEGASYVTVEEPAHAEARGAKVMAYCVGYGTAFEAPESEARLVYVSATGIERAVRGALRDASLSPADIDVVVSSACGMPAFDKAESAARKKLFEEEPSVVATKQVFGETFGAHGAMGVVSALAFLDGTPAEPRLSGSAPSSVNNVLVITAGFYGNATALVLQRPA